MGHRPATATTSRTRRHRYIGSAIILGSLTPFAHGLSPQPENPTLQSGIQPPSILPTEPVPDRSFSSPPLPTDECCGYLNFPACTTYDYATGSRVHSCYSDGHPTIGAIRTLDRGYVCQTCGYPAQPACECTHTNSAVNPCDHGVTHWCLYGPEFTAIPAANGQHLCMRNETGAQPTRARRCACACRMQATLMHTP